MSKKITLVSEDKLGAAITALGQARAKSDNLSHVLACSAVAAFIKEGSDGKPCGNVFYINNLYNSLGKGARHAAMTAWLLACGGVMANPEPAKAKQTPFVKDPNKTVDLEAAMKQPWFNFKPSPKPADVPDLVKMVQAIIDKAAKAQEKDPTCVMRGEEGLTKLKEFVEQFGAEADIEESVTGETEAS
jgi:hypothetical protein